MIWEINHTSLYLLKKKNLERINTKTTNENKIRSLFLFVLQTIAHKIKRFSTISFAYLIQHFLPELFSLLLFYIKVRGKLPSNIRFKRNKLYVLEYFIMISLIVLSTYSTLIIRLFHFFFFRKNICTGWSLRESLGYYIKIK